MTYINRNTVLNQFQELVQKDLHKKLDYMSDDFNNQQKYALELFQKRISLEKTIDETIAFNKKISFLMIQIKNLHLTTTAEELIDVYKLRSDVLYRTWL